MASAYFLKAEGIDGMSGDKNHEKWIEVISFTHGAHQNVSIERGGDVAGRGQFYPFQFTHAVDKATPKFQHACVTGSKIGKIEFEFSRVIGGDATAVYQVVLENCRIAKAEIKTLNAGGEDPLSEQPIEVVDVVAGKETWKVTPIKPDGSKDGAIEASFNQIENA